LGRSGKGHEVVVTGIGSEAGFEVGVAVKLNKSAQGANELVRLSFRQVRPELGPMEDILDLLEKCGARDHDEFLVCRTRK
jgi:hypothetical protein